MKELNKLFDQAHNRNYPKSQIVLYQGEKARDIYYINRGHVKVYDVTASGTEKLILILGPGDIFPLIWSFKAPTNLHYFYETFDEAEIKVLPRQKVINAVSDNHQITIQLLQYFVDKTSDLLSRVDCIEATSAKHKVCQVLLYLATAHGTKVAKSGYSISLDITHQAIANMAGLTRATASVQMKELEKAKMFSHHDRKLLIHSDRISDFLEEIG
jgi:CRP/FNR family transcriptional regulator